MSFLIRTSTDLYLFAVPRSFSQLVTSFFGAMYQGILLYALCSLIFFVKHFRAYRRISYSFCFLDSRLTLSVNCSYVFLFLVLTFRFLLVYLSCLNVLYLSLLKSLLVRYILCYISLSLSMQLSIYAQIASAIFNVFRRLVGTSGLGPPTSRLSGVCSNQLSYVPV